MSQHPRVQIRRKTSDYYLVFEGMSGELLGRLADLSMAGMRIITTEQLAVGGRFKFRLSLPEPIGKTDSIVVCCTCVWARENEEAGWHESGHVFQSLDDPARATITELVNKIMVEESDRINRIPSR